MDQSINPLLQLIDETVYRKCDYRLHALQNELESREYGGCKFLLDKRILLSRNAKVTPKKIGQFVTFWKRIDGGPIQPFDKTDSVDFLVVNVANETEFGQFVFPKSTLVKQGIISTPEKEGKRGFRVYPPWDVVESKQAKRTQNWQLEFFLEIGDSIDMELVERLYTS